MNVSKGLTSYNELLEGIFGSSKIYTGRGETVWAAYKNLIKPIIPFGRRKEEEGGLGDGGLRDFFVHMKLPDPQTSSARSIRDDRERELEAMVMGKTYDAVSRGKWKAMTQYMYSLEKEAVKGKQEGRWETEEELDEGVVLDSTGYQIWPPLPNEDEKSKNALNI